MPLIRLDPHAHLYDPYRLADWIEAAILNLAPDNDAERAVIIVDRQGQDSFARIEREISDIGSWRVAQPESGSNADAINGVVTFKDKTLNVVRGVQYVSAEKIEVLGWGVKRECDDGAPCQDLVEKIKASGGVVCLPWSPGKWIGKRGKIVNEVLRLNSPDNLVLGDIAIRSRFGPPSVILRRAKRASFQIICGTDPLPRREDARLVGSYGVELFAPSELDSRDRVLELLQLIKSPVIPKRVWGRPSVPVAALERFISSLRGRS